MKVIDRHLSGEFSRLFVGSVVVFLAIFLVVEFFEKLRMLLSHHASAADALAFFAARLPWMLVQIIPLSVLLGTLLSLSLLSRHGEITAFRCGGVPLARMALPLVGCGLALAGVTLLLQEIGVPRGEAFAREVKEVRIRGGSLRELREATDVWLRAGPSILHAGRVVPEEAKLLDLSLIELSPAGAARRIDAAEARWNGRTWILRDAEVRRFDPNGGIELTRRTEMPYALPQSPEDFRIQKLEPEELGWTALRSRIRHARERGLDARELRVELWARTSLPFACAVMPLLGFPFALRTGRRGGTSLGIAFGVALGFCYWLVLAVGLSLGKTGLLPAPLAAWAGNLLFGALGCALLHRAEGRG